MTDHTPGKDFYRRIVTLIKTMSLFRPTSEFASSANLHEAILASSSSVRDSLPERHHKHFETLRQEIIDFAQAHNIPRESLAKPQDLQEAAKKLSTPDLERLANLLERFEYLLVHHEPNKEDYAEALEYVERLYHFKEQYDSQISLLKEVGILKEGAIIGIDGKRYPIPTLEQIAVRLFERREELKTKHDQGFTKLLLVPFGMSLDVLQETLKQFLLDYKKNNPTFALDTNEPLWVWEDYKGADIGDSPKLVYYPKSFIGEDHGGKTKMEILKEQAEGRWTPASAGVAVGAQSATGVAGGSGGGVAQGSETGFPAWTIHLLQPSNLDTQDTETPTGFAPIPRKDQGTPQGDITLRLPLEAGQSPNEYFSILKKAQNDPNHPYSLESGMTPEDWIMAFITHLQETGKPMDNWQNNTESISYLTGAFFPSSVDVPHVYWNGAGRQVILGRSNLRRQDGGFGLRSSVMV